MCASRRRRTFGCLARDAKKRICPLWPQTAEILSALLAERGGTPPSNDALFRNRLGASLSRFGVRYILRKHCARAHAVRPALANKRLHPHRMRHSSAVHRYERGATSLRSASGLAGDRPYYKQGSGKPFHMSELTARIDAVIRRSSGPKTPRSSRFRFEGANPGRSAPLLVPFPPLRGPASRRSGVLSFSIPVTQNIVDLSTAVHAALSHHAHQHLHNLFLTDPSLLVQK
jgi:hypothetical protein